MASGLFTKNNMQKHIIAALFVGSGLILLLFLSSRSLVTEKNYFESLILSSNRDVAFLAARHAVDELQKIRQQIDGLGRLILREDFSSEKIQSHLRYHFENHPSLVALRYRRLEDRNWTEFHNVGSGLSNTLPQHPVALMEEIARASTDLYLEPYEVRSVQMLSRIQMIKDLRGNKIPGLIEAQISVEKLFGSAVELSRQKGGAIVIVGPGGQVLVPRIGGHAFSENEFKKMREEGFGGVRRQQGAAEELLAWCSFSLLEPVHAPDWLVVYVEQDQSIQDFLKRIRSNLTGLVLVGLLSMLLLTRLVIYK